MITKAVDFDPHNSAYLDSLGWVYYRLNRFAEAEEQLRHSIRRGSRDATVHDHLGDVLLSLGNLKEAIAQWERAAEEWRKSAPSDLDTAELAKVQKKLESAKIRVAKEGAAAQKQP
jgi:tetratricopeptide (TPR) repeat protein